MRSPGTGHTPEASAALGDRRELEAPLRINTEFALFLLCEASHNRKNYLHVGSDAGGHTAAVMYTLLGTAKLNGINPQRYLRYVLECLADHPSNRIDELLPWVVAEKWADDASAKDMPLAA